MGRSARTLIHANPASTAALRGLSLPFVKALRGMLKEAGNHA
jgi:hypothetical protein